MAETLILVFGQYGQIWPNMTSTPIKNTIITFVDPEIVGIDTGFD